MKNILLVPVLIVAALLMACEKVSTYNNSILVKVLYNGESVSNAMVHLTKDTLADPLSSKRADAIGEVYFNKIAPGHYYLYATGSVPGTHQQVYGITQLNIDNRAYQNHYDVKINTGLK